MQDQIIQVEDSALIQKDDILALARVAEERIKAVKRLLTAALKVTNERDWVNLGGSPYLQSSGAEKIARLFGISWFNMNIEKEEREDSKGKYYIYTCSATFTMGNTHIEAIGTCSSRARFFAISHGELKPIEEIDETNIKKTAMTNCIRNGVTRLLGLRNIDWEMIKDAGIDIRKILSIQYKKKEEEKEPKELPKQGQLNVKS